MYSSPKHWFIIQWNHVKNNYLRYWILIAGKRKSNKQYMCGVCVWQRHQQSNCWIGKEPLLNTIQSAELCTAPAAGVCCIVTKVTTNRAKLWYKKENVSCKLKSHHKPCQRHCCYRFAHQHSHDLMVVCSVFSIEFICFSLAGFTQFAER